MNDNKRILVAIDESEGTRKALEYVAGMENRSDEFHIHLLHATRPTPPELQEFGGSEGPAKERELQAELKQKQVRWTHNTAAAALPVLKDARRQLEKEGLTAEMMDLELRPLKHPEDLVSEIVKTARERRCGTVIVGRNSFPWSKEIFADHLGEELARQAEGISVKVVG